MALPLAALVALGRAPAGTEPSVRYLRIAADPSGERGFEVGSALAAMLSRPPGMPTCANDRACGVPGLVAVAQSLPDRDGIVTAVASGAMETGLAPADRIYAARCMAETGAAGSAPLTILGEIYDEALHVLVRAETSLTSVGQLKGRPVAIGTPGSEERRLAERILTSNGLRLRDVRGVALSGTDAAQALADGKLDALFIIAAAPDPVVTSAMNAGARLLPIDGDVAGRLSGLHPFGTPGHIAAGIYGPDQPDIATLMQPVAWIAGPALDPALAAELTAALASRPNREALHRQDPDMELLRPAAFRMSAPLHPAVGTRYGIDPIAMACPRLKPR